MRCILQLTLLAPGAGWWVRAYLPFAGPTGTGTGSWSTASGVAVAAGLRSGTRSPIGLGVRTASASSAEVAGLEDGVIRVADDLLGAELRQADGGLRNRTVPVALNMAPASAATSGMNWSGSVSVNRSSARRTAPVSVSR